MWDNHFLKVDVEMMLSGNRLSRRSLAAMFFVLASLLTSVLGLSAGAEESLLQRAKWIPDGDTILLESGQWVRLQGIDAPETGHDNQPGQYYATESASTLRGMVTGKPLTVVSHGKDRHGRTLGTCLLADGTDVAETMVLEGCAFYYPHPDHGQDLHTRLLAAQRWAMRQGKGFWPRIQALSAKQGQWVGNRRSGRAFPQDSPDAQRINAVNRVVLISLWDVFLQGYSPARGASPWPLDDQRSSLSSQPADSPRNPHEAILLRAQL
ncbi:MAG: thermonuclease family protein [Proteobacteria bacterium]|nr:thermonuclease family protein [Pseudomonadota bacterium]